MDIFCSEYGWSIEQVMQMPYDLVPYLLRSAMHRKGIRTIAKSISKNDEGKLTSKIDDIFGRLTSSN